MKVPNALPVLEAPALLVILPPPSMSAAALPAITPELLRVAAPPLANTPVVAPEIDPRTAFVSVLPAARSTVRAPVMLPLFASVLTPPVMKMPNALPEAHDPALLVTLPPRSMSRSGVACRRRADAAGIIDGHTKITARGDCPRHRCLLKACGRQSRHFHHWERRSGLCAINTKVSAPCSGATAR